MNCWSLEDFHLCAVMTDAFSFSPRNPLKIMHTHIIHFMGETTYVHSSLAVAAAAWWQQLGGSMAAAADCF
jgi:hypothetical protein